MKKTGAAGKDDALLFAIIKGKQDEFEVMSLQVTPRLEKHDTPHHKQKQPRNLFTLHTWATAESDSC